jgi:hypothetical protein
MRIRKEQLFRHPTGSDWEIKSSLFSTVLKFNHNIETASEDSPKYRKSRLYFLVFQAQNCHTEQGFPTTFIPPYLIFVLLQASLAQGIDEAFLVSLLKIVVAVLSDILQGDFGIYS